MSTDTVRPLRERMIEDVECAQALCRHAEGPHPQLQAFRCILNGLPEQRRLRNLHVGVTGPEPPFLLTPVANHQG